MQAKLSAQVYLGQKISQSLPPKAINIRTYTKKLFLFISLGLSKRNMKKGMYRSEKNNNNEKSGIGTRTTQATITYCCEKEPKGHKFLGQFLIYNEIKKTWKEKKEKQAKINDFLYSLCLDLYAMNVAFL